MRFFWRRSRQSNGSGSFLTPGILGEGVRRCRLRRFPYGLIYHADEVGVLLIAVAHTHRRPGYWSERLKGR